MHFHEFKMLYLPQQLCEVLKSPMNDQKLLLGLIKPYIDNRQNKLGGTLFHLLIYEIKYFTPQ